jgi:F-type H+-transporting ATPase subunit alpha
MKQVAGRLRMDLAYFNELQAFSQFASDLDQSTKDALNRGERLLELLKQPQYQPQSVEDQVLLLWIGTNGYLDDIPVSAIKRFEKEFQAFIMNRYPQIPVTVIEKKAIDNELTEQITNAVKEFKSQFKAN